MGRKLFYFYGITVILIYFFLGSSAWAHGVRISALADGKTILGQVTFQGGEPVKNCIVRGHDNADEVLAETKTDDNGRFSFEARWRCDYHLEAETEDGHGGEYAIKASLLPSDLPSREKKDTATTPTAEHSSHHSHSEPGDENPWTVEQIRSIQSKLDSMQEKLDTSEHSIRLRDALGGVGYILGVFGLYALAVKRGKNRDRSEKSAQ
jgi:nickel transport protein